MSNSTEGILRMDASECILLVILSILWGGSFFFFKVLVVVLPPFTVVLGRVGAALAPLVAQIDALDRELDGSINGLFSADVERAAGP